MTVSPQIRHLKRTEIDDVRWNECINRAENGLIYGLSFYLDALCTNWDGLILNDYEVVMPLPWRKKFGISYVYQPAFTAQLGVFGCGIDKKILTAFVQAIPSCFRYIDCPLNFKNVFSSSLTTERTNYVLSLLPSYLDITGGYHQNIKRNIRRATNNQLQLKKNIAVENVIKISRAQIAKWKLPESDLRHFQNLYSGLYEKKMAKSYGVLSAQNELLSAAVFFFHNKRVYYILVGNDVKSKKLGASHFLIDSFIKEHAESDLTIDFEGSDIPTLALFYAGFGAHKENYAHLKLNRLPWPLKWIKP